MVMKKILISILFVAYSLVGYSQSLFNKWIPASGTDTYSTNITALTSLSNSVVYLKFANTNTGASTLTINTTLGPSALRMWDGDSWEALTAGQIDVNTIYKISYQGSYFEMESFGSGGGSVSDWGDIGGTLSDQTDLQAALDDKQDGLISGTNIKTVNSTSLLGSGNLAVGDITYANLMSSRTMTSGDDLDQTDNFAIVYANSASPFNITVDLLTTGSQVTVWNKGSATVTLVAGSGVTLSNTDVDTDEIAVIVYEPAATPSVRLSSGSGGGGSGTVTSVGFTGGIISVANPTTTPAFTVAGTSGGIPYFSSSSTWATSAALAANAIVIGGGAGVAPSTTTTGTGMLTFIGTPSSANLRSTLTDESGTGSAYFQGGDIGTPSAGVATNLTGTATGLTSGITNGLKSATTTVSVSAATAPTSGQVLTATNSTTATWQTPSSGFSDPMTTRGDIIVRDASNVTNRLAIGASGRLLTSDGTDVSWTAPTFWSLASGGALTADNSITGAFKVGLNNKGVEINQTAQSSSWLPTVKILNGAHTSLTAATEFISEDYGTSSPATLTWATGTVATQRDRVWRGIIHSGANPTTFTRLIGNQFDVPTVTGTGVTSTNAFALASNGPLVVYSGDGSTERFKVSSTGVLTFGASTITPGTSFVLGSGMGLGLNGQAASSAGRISGVTEFLSQVNSSIAIMTPSTTLTSGTLTSYNFTTGFAPASGTAVWNLVGVSGTINQAGGANGNSTLFNVIPTYTAVGGNITMWDYNPTITSISGTHYGMLVRPTGALNGFGTGTPNSTVQVNGSWSGGYVAKTGTYTATVNDYTIECTANTFTVTLPTAVGITGRIYHIVNSGAGTITVGTTSSQTFVNVTATPTTLTMATVGTTSVQSNGANWIKLSGL